MKKMFVLIFSVCFALLLQGAGYVGEKPDIDSFFVLDRNNAIKNINSSPIKEVSQKIDAPPSNITKKIDLAPSNINKDNFNLINQTKKVGYFKDMFEMKNRIKSLQDTIMTSSKLQDYAAKVNMFKFYSDTFIDKYKNKPDAKRPSYKSVKEVSDESQKILHLWMEARDNSKYVPYSAFSGSYQPSVIRAKLKKLNVKLEQTLMVMDEVAL